MKPKAIESAKIPVAHPVFAGNEKKYVLECLDSGWISSLGDFITRFEDAFAKFCGTTSAIACNNGTSALHLALAGLGVRPGDEVLVPTLTYVATANAVTYCGARPVFVDSEPRTLAIDPSRIEAAITPRTRAIVVVHLYGHPADMDPIVEIARRRGLFVIEDAAEAHGALYKGQTIGSLGDAATFSFYGNKIITTGEGGMVTTSNPELARKIRLLRGQGMDPHRRYWFPEIGYNYRMTNVAAAIGLAQLEQITDFLETRFQLAEIYHRELGRLSRYVERPSQEPWARHAFWSYPTTLTDACPLDRDEAMIRLDADGIETRPVFYPMHCMPPYREESSYPVADRASQRGICLPMHGLLSPGDIGYIARRLGALCE